MYCCENRRKAAQKKGSKGAHSKNCRWLHPGRYASPGPNFISYINSHNKLKPYRFSIHRCIDKLSWKMLWLKVPTSNKMPEVLAIISQCCQTV